MNGLNVLLNVVIVTTLYVIIHHVLPASLVPIYGFVSFFVCFKQIAKAIAISISCSNDILNRLMYAELFWYACVNALYTCRSTSSSYRVLQHVA